MDKGPNTTWFFNPWIRIIGLTLMIASVFYAVEHPHSIFYDIVKVIFSPIP
jgi:hypothetical protein